MDLRKSGLDLRKRGFGPQEEGLWTSGTGAWTSGRALGHLLESLLESLGLLVASWRPLGSVLEEAIGAILGRSKTNCESGFSHLGGQKASKIDPKANKNRKKRLQTKAQKQEPWAPARLGGNNRKSSLLGPRRTTNHLSND